MRFACSAGISGTTSGGKKMSEMRKSAVMPGKSTAPTERWPYTRSKMM